MSTLPPRPAPFHPSPSPSYVPRSRPSSPALPAFPPASSSSSTSGGGHGHKRSHSASPLLTPRLSGLASDPQGRRGSALRNEVVDERSASQVRAVVNRAKSEDKENAEAILKLLSALPAPLPSTLPSRFLPTPSPSPPSRLPQSFSDYAAASHPHPSPSTHSKRRRSSSSSSSSPPPTQLAGLGLSLPAEPASSSTKRRKLSGELVRSASSPLLSSQGRGLTPGMGSPALGKAGRGSGSGLKYEVPEEGEVREGEDVDMGMGMGEGVEVNREGWSKEQWRDAGQQYRARALLLKRHGDAYQRSPSAQPQYLSLLPLDPLKGLLCLTDAVLLWLFAYWCEEQAGGRVRTTPYTESAPLREFVRRGWETEARKNKTEEGRERAKGMVGLMHLIEAVVSYHLTSEQLAHLSRRGKELASVPTAPSSSSRQGSGSGSGGTHTGPSPPDSASPPHSAPGPSPSHSSPPDSVSSSGGYTLPPDLLPLLTSATSSSSRASTHLLTSRHHLTLRLLRDAFPTTYAHAIHSDLAEEALPAPGDALGAAKRLDVDRTDRFAWPIELGMWCAVAHCVVFGRGLVRECAERAGREWAVRLEG